MRRSVDLRRSGNGYLLELTPSQFELVRRVLISLYHGRNSVDLLEVVAGGRPVELSNIQDRIVDFRSRENIEMELSRAGVRALYGALSFAYLNRSSEEAFHVKYGFYSENVQEVAWGLCEALQVLDN